MDDINFKSYIKATKHKEKIKKKEYKYMLKLVNKEISDALHYSDHVICDIPPLMIDIPEYNPIEAIDYILKKLLSNKTFEMIIIDVKVFDQCKLYFKWDISLLK